LVNLRLPAAARDDLDQAVRYALMRHVPMDLSQAWIDQAVLDDADELDVEAVVALHDQLGPVMDAVDQAGMRVAGVFPALAHVARSSGQDGFYLSAGQGNAEALVLEQGRVVVHGWEELGPNMGLEQFLTSLKPMLDNRAQPPEHVFCWECTPAPDEIAAPLGLPAAAVQSPSPVFSRTLLEQAPYRIDLASGGLGNRRALVLRLAAASVFVLALLLYPLGSMLGKQAHLDQLEERISQIRGQAEVIAQKRREIQDSADFLRRIAQEAQNQPLVLEMLHELTQVLPRNVWLDSFVFARDRVRIQGQADSATSVIEALENSPLFRAVGFESPVTKSGKRDVFQVSAELEP
jgi:Tfp pilus assembly protein PilN